MSGEEIGIMWRLVLCALCAPSIFTLAYSYHEGNHDRWYQPVVRRPVDIVTDVVNDLGVRILQQYAGHGNVAFSPTGVGFVLAALYEGSAGRGSLQIENALGLPRDRDITRIGFRDVHRRLRTYLNADGFLGGLTLNKANTALRPEYEDILRFYGFDLSTSEQEMNATMAPESTASTDSGSNGVENKNDGEIPMNGNIPANGNNGNTPMNENIPTSENTPTNKDNENAPVDDNNGNTNTESLETTPQTDSTTISDVEILESTMNPEPSSRLTEMGTNTPRSNTNSVTTPRSTTVPAETTSTIVSTTIASETTVSPLTIADQTAGTTTQIIETTLSADSEATTQISTTGSSVITESTDSAASAESVTMSTMMMNSVMMNSMTEGSMLTTMNIARMDVDGEFLEESTTVNDNVDNVETTTQAGPETSTVMMDSSTDSASTTMGAEDLGGTTASSAGVTDDSMNRIRKRSVRSPRGYFSSYPDEGIWMQDLGIWKAYPSGTGEATVRDSTEISFLVNGCDVSSVSATRYIAVLPFAYFPSLHAVALEFPLDDPRYNVLLLMPTDRSDTHRLARDLDGKSLRLLRKQLQPTWVRATIPSFMLRGFVTLTPFLQRLGIIDVFEPRVADLSPMTIDLGVYARDVQQSIGVNIRNYMKPDRTHSRNGLFERAGPVPFTALHPFLYFIIDAETSITLIAGRVEDPLNSRIL